MSKPTAFPLDESKLPFRIPKNQPFRENIAKLGQMITDRIPAKKGTLTQDDPEYWGLASIVTDEMAKVALKMKVRKLMTLPELVKATGKPADELEPLLQQMAVVGLLEYNWENPRREKQYILPMFVPGSAEFFNMNKQQIADHPEVTAFFERMTFLPLEHITAMVPPGGAGIGMHVIPVEKAIETENQSVDVEHISHWLKKYDGKYAAGPCSCRMSRAAVPTVRRGTACISSRTVLARRTARKVSRMVDMEGTSQAMKKPDAGHRAGWLNCGAVRKRCNRHQSCHQLYC